MATEQYANDAHSTLLFQMDATQTTLYPVSMVGFPAVPQFRVLVDEEIMLVTAILGNHFVVSRAAEPWAGVQVAAPHSTGATVIGVLTAGALLNLPGLGGGLAIGQPVSGGSAGRVLFVDPAIHLDQSSRFIWDNVNFRLTISGNGASYAFVVTGGGASAQFCQQVGGVITAWNITDGTRTVLIAASNQYGISASDGTYSCAVVWTGHAAFQAADGTHTVQIAYGTGAISYVAGAPTSWAGSSAPDDVWIAIDRLASACNALGFPP